MSFKNRIGEMIIIYITYVAAILYSKNGLITSGIRGINN